MNNEVKLEDLHIGQILNWDGKSFYTDCGGSHKPLDDNEPQQVRVVVIDSTETEMPLCCMYKDEDGDDVSVWLSLDNVSLI